MPVYSTLENDFQISNSEHGLRRAEVHVIDPQVGRSVSDSLKHVGMDWEVDFGLIYDESGNAVQGPWRRIVRSDTSDTLGVVKSKYHLLQNEDAFGFIDDLIENAGCSIRKAGLYRGGAICWMYLNLGETNVIRDDVVEKNLIVYTSHDGTSRLSVLPTPHRLVCDNQLHFSKARELEGFSAFGSSHTKSILNARVNIANFVDQFYSIMDSKIAAMRRMVEFEIPEDQTDYFIYKLLSVTDSEIQEYLEGGYNKKTSWVSNAEKIKVLYESDPSLIDSRKTLWGVYNAVNSFYEHAKHKSGLTDADRLFKTQFGSNMDHKVSAFQNAEQILIALD